MGMRRLRVCINGCAAYPLSRRSTMITYACIGTAIFLAAMLGPAAAETKRVLMLHSFGRDVKPWSDYARNIRAELDQQSPWSLEFSDHSLMAARSSDEDSEAPFAEYLRALHAKRQPDLIVSLGAPAVVFVQPTGKNSLPPPQWCSQ